MAVSVSSSAGLRGRAKPPGHMGPPSVMGLSVGRDVSMSPPDEGTVILCCKVGVSLSLSLSLFSVFRSFFAYLCLWLSLRLCAYVCLSLSLYPLSLSLSCLLACTACGLEAENPQTLRASATLSVHVLFVGETWLSLSLSPGLGDGSTSPGFKAHPLR